MQLQAFTYRKTYGAAMLLEAYTVILDRHAQTAKRAECAFVFFVRSEHSHDHTLE